MEWLTIWRHWPVSELMDRSQMNIKSISILSVFVQEIVLLVLTISEPLVQLTLSFANKSTMAEPFLWVEPLATGNQETIHIQLLIFLEIAYHLQGQLMKDLWSTFYTGIIAPILFKEIQLSILFVIQMLELGFPESHFPVQLKRLKAIFVNTILPGNHFTVVLFALKKITALLFRNAKWAKDCPILLD